MVLGVGLAWAGLCRDRFAGGVFKFSGRPTLPLDFSLRISAFRCLFSCRDMLVEWHGKLTEYVSSYL